MLFFALFTYILACIKPAEILKIVEWGFGGFSILFFPVLASLYWKRCTKSAAMAAILVGQFLNAAEPVFSQEIIIT